MILSAGLKNINHCWQSSGVQACRDISLDLQEGCLHALVGENGAGKSTLGMILSGVLKPDSGTLHLKSKQINLKEKPGGLISEIGLVRQRNIWPSVLTVREAAVLGRERRPKSNREQLAAFTHTANKWGLKDIDPRIPVSSLDAAALQRAEMIAALMFNPEVLVLDEPSSAWEEGRDIEFFHLLNQLKDSGRAVLLITHRLEDVFKIADQVTVMRHGSVMGSWNVCDMDYSMLTREMFGEDTKPLTIRKTAAASKNRRSTEDSPGSAVLQAVNISIIESGRVVLDNVSFNLYPGEIVGITGLREEGLLELENAVSGNRSLDSGKLLLNAQTVSGGAAGMRQAGLHYVPSDKTGRGSSLSSTMTENMMILESRKLSYRGLLNPRRVKSWIEAHRQEGGISGRPDQKLEELSGGNIQKVILQREINRNTRLLVIADPTWGLDQQSRQQIYEKLKGIRDRGAAILLLASELDEALELSDRMAVIHGGKISEIKAAELWERNDAARCIAGLVPRGSGGGTE